MAAQVANESPPKAPSIPMLLECRIPALELSIKLCFDLDLGKRVQVLTQQVLDTVAGQASKEMSRLGVAVCPVQTKAEVAQQTERASRELEAWRRKLKQADEVREKATQRVSEMRADCLREVTQLREQIHQLQTSNKDAARGRQHAVTLCGSNAFSADFEGGEDPQKDEDELVNGVLQIRYRSERLKTQRLRSIVDNGKLKIEDLEFVLKRCRRMDPQTSSKVALRDASDMVSQSTQCEQGVLQPVNQDTQTNAVTPDVDNVWTQTDLTAEQLNDLCTRRQSGDSDATRHEASRDSNMTGLCSACAQQRRNNTVDLQYPECFTPDLLLEALEDDELSETSLSECSRRLPCSAVSGRSSGKYCMPIKLGPFASTDVAESMRRYGIIRDTGDTNSTECRSLTSNTSGAISLNESVHSGSETPSPPPVGKPSRRSPGVQRMLRTARAQAASKNCSWQLPDLGARRLSEIKTPATSSEHSPLTSYCPSPQDSDVETAPSLSRPFCINAPEQKHCPVRPSRSPLLHRPPLSARLERAAKSIN
eukprot:TRINITY_DN16581_c0_g1_i1.p1 TRINITY_DN16581_c0_g1~~TRINITY_DN16581_c0_g1_i1.p1  ORF type:complete len:537 (-),score=72.28 TRINITY_DN16581_c0_g1_i1:271-1881(-)